MSLTQRTYTAIINEDKILCTKDVGEEGWKFPGGHVEEGESFEQALLREVSEEVGLEIEIKGVFLEEKYNRAGQEDSLVDKMFYLAKAKSGEVVIDPKEVEKFKWFSFEEFIAIPLYEIYESHLGAFLRMRKILNNDNKV